MGEGRSQESGVRRNRNYKEGSQKNCPWIFLLNHPKIGLADIDQEFIYYLQQKDIGWIQQVKIDSHLDIINLFKVNPEQLDECVID